MIFSCSTHACTHTLTLTLTHAHAHIHTHAHTHTHHHIATHTHTHTRTHITTLPWASLMVPVPTASPISHVPVRHDLLLMIHMSDDVTYVSCIQSTTGTLHTYACSTHMHALRLGPSAHSFLSPLGRRVAPLPLFIRVGDTYNYT